MKNIGKEFIKGTQYPDYSTVDLVLRVPEPPHELPVREGQTIIKLPSPKKFKVPDIPVRKAIENWEPVGFFSRSSITLKNSRTCSGARRGSRRSWQRPSSSAMCPQAVPATRWRPTLWQTMSKGLRPGCTGTSRSPTASWPNGSIPA